MREQTARNSADNTETFRSSPKYKRKYAEYVWPHELCQFSLNCSMLRVLDRAGGLGFNSERKTFGHRDCLLVCVSNSLGLSGKDSCESGNSANGCETVKRTVERTIESEVARKGCV